MTFRPPNTGGGASTFIQLTDVPNSYAGAALKVTRVNAGETGLEFATVSGTGDVVGPASATDNAVARFDGTTGKLIQNSAVTIADTSGDITAGKYNKVTVTAPATGATLTIADGKTFTVSNTLTLTGTDGTSFAFPVGSSTVVTLDSTATLTNKTLTTPTIGDFSNANHNHTNSAGGGQLTDAALSAAVGVLKGGTGSTTASGARTNLGLAIGSDVQAFDATLQSISALGTGADKTLYTTGVDTWAETPLTSFGRSLIDDAAASNARTTLGLGTIATQDANNVTITGGSITNITDLAVADGGTGASTAANARTNLGLAIGTNVEAWDATLDALAAFNTNGIMVQTAADTFTARTITASNGVSVTNGGGIAAAPAFTLDITGLTQDSTPDSASDFVATYDTSAATNKKVLLKDLGTSMGITQAVRSGFVYTYITALS